MPLAIEVTFATGRYVAADVNNREQPEWPPHLARVFAALVEAWARYGSDPPDLDEQAALEWLERQRDPTIADPGGSPRRAVGLFVPVNNATEPSANDKKRGVTKMRTLLQEERKRTPRLSVPSTLVGGDGRVVFAWPQSEPTAEHREALTRMLGRVTRLGHSSSFVTCRLIDDPPDPVWVPHQGSSGAAFSLRGTYAGMLDMLVARHDSYLETGLRNIPMRSATLFYVGAPGRVANPMRLTNDASSEWIVFKMEKPSRLSSTGAAWVARALRGGLISHCSGSPPKLLVGKENDGRPTTSPHALFLSLPFVGHRHADGLIKGAAVLIPPESDTAERRVVLRAINAWETSCAGRPLELHLGSRGVAKMRRLSARDATDTKALDPGVWSRQSRRWGSVTALALPREAYKLTRGSPSDIRRAWRQAEEAVVESCRFAGLPEPEAVDVGFDPPVRGGSHASDYPAFAQSGKKRLLLHAVVEFSEPVLGPLILGSGRFRGLGLMRPMDPAKTGDQ